MAPGTNCGPVDARCPKNIAVAIAGLADRSGCQASGAPAFGPCAPGYVWSPYFGLIGRGSLDCFYANDGSSVSSRACDNGPGDTGGGDCHLGGVLGASTLSSACSTSNVLAGCFGGTGAGGAGGAGGTSGATISAACPADYDRAMASLTMSTACTADNQLMAVETCGALRTWAWLGVTHSDECVYASDGTLVGSVSCESVACTFAGTRVDDGSCTSVNFSHCGGL